MVNQQLVDIQDEINSNAYGLGDDKKKSGKDASRAPTPVPDKSQAAKPDHKRQDTALTNNKQADSTKEYQGDPIRVSLDKSLELPPVSSEKKPDELKKDDTTKKDEPSKKDEAKKDEAKKDEPKKDEPKKED